MKRIALTLFAPLVVTRADREPTRIRPGARLQPVTDDGLLVLPVD